MSMIDYPGKIAASIFTSLCNFRCPYCHNPEMIECPDNYPDINPETIINDMLKSKKWIDGIVIGGGEPTMHNDLPGFCKKIKAHGFLIKLDTNGTNPKMLSELLKNKLIDYVAMDIKAPKEKYAKVTQSKIDVKKIQESINLLMKSKIDYEFRTTVMPSLITKSDIEAISNWLKGAKHYSIQQFRPAKTLDPSYENEKSYTPDQLEELASIARKYFKEVEIKGA